MLENNMCQYAPVVAFAYNRAEKIERCLENLDKNPEAQNTDLYIYCDGPKNDQGIADVENTRKALREYKEKSRFANVYLVESKYNKGLATSIMNGVSEVVNKYGRAIIVEDDLKVSESFLKYMNEALDYYQDNPRIGAICGYTYPLKGLDNYDKDVYVMHKGDCWGWATWKDRWNNASWAEVDFDAYFADKNLRRRFENTENGWDLLMILLSENKTSSWAVRWVLYLLQNDLWTVYPKTSLVVNAGFDGSGSHSNKYEERLYYRPDLEAKSEFKFEQLEPDKKLEKEAAKHPRKGFVNGSVYWLKRLYVKLYNLKLVKR